MRCYTNTVWCSDYNWEQVSTFMIYYDLPDILKSFILVTPLILYFFSPIKGFSISQTFWWITKPIKLVTQIVGRDSSLICSEYVGISPIYFLVRSENTIEKHNKCLTLLVQTESNEKGKLIEIRKYKSNLHIFPGLIRQDIASLVQYK